MAVKKAVLDKKTIEEMVAEYNELRLREKTISDRKKVLADAIKAFVLKNGTKDSKGSFYSENDSFTYGAQCKKSIKFDVEKASDFLKKIGHEECIVMTPSIDGDAVSQLVEDGAMSFDDMESITNTSVTYSIDVKQKEEMPEVQTSTVAAASRKPLRKKVK